MPQTAPVTKAQIAAALQLILTVGEIIKLKGEIPSGELYVLLMEKGITLEQHQQIIAQLVKAKMVSNTNHLLTWIGPK